jgi:hypothetical protein
MAARRAFIVILSFPLRNAINSRAMADSDAIQVTPEMTHFAFILLSLQNIVRMRSKQGSTPREAFVKVTSLLAFELQ